MKSSTDNRLTKKKKRKKKQGCFDHMFRLAVLGLIRKTKATGQPSLPMFQKKKKKTERRVTYLKQLQIIKQGLFKCWIPFSQLHYRISFKGAIDVMWKSHKRLFEQEQYIHKRGHAPGNCPVHSHMLYLSITVEQCRWIQNRNISPSTHIKKGLVL